mmetsp:Transcript_16969/g.21986  ORF Transcript_16969/g.21986 Transcript_16969/m.21986 type:complete len:423 (+) Transcript_16969:46-1314(+)
MSRNNGPPRIAPPRTGRRPTVIVNTTNSGSGPVPPRGSWRAGEQAYMNVLALTDAELREIEANLEHERTLQIGSRAEISVLSALTRRYDAIDTDGCLHIFDLIDRDRNGYLTKEELRKGVQANEVRDYVEKTRNATLKGLLKNDSKRFDAVFAAIARCENPREAVVITKSDFSKFVRAVALERLRYMRVIGLLKRRCYWGRGLNNERQDTHNDQKSTQKKNCIFYQIILFLCCCWCCAKKRCCCCFDNCCATLCCVWKYPKGYCADLWFYMRNNHPYLALFFRDEAHPFSRRDAFCAELIKQCYCLLASIYVDKQEKNWMTYHGALFNWKLSVIFVALPSMIIDELLFYALACPCLRFEHRGRRRERIYSKFESCGDCLGRFIVIPFALLSLALIGFALYIFYQNPTDHADFALFLDYWSFI